MKGCKIKLLSTILQKLQIENFYWNIGFYALIIAGTGHFFFIFLFLYLEIPELAILNILSVVTYLYCIFGLGLKTLETKDDSLIGWIVYFELIIHAAVVTKYIGVESGFQYYMYALVMLPFFTFSYTKKIKILRILFVIIFAMLIEILGYAFEPLIILEREQLVLVHHMNLFIFLFCMSIILYIYTQSNQIYQETLVDQNTVDPLTNLFNRRYIIQASEKNFLENKIDGIKFALLIIDIDYFKKVNDTYGHTCGDNMLIEISNLIKQNVRPNSIVSRWGGEEFLILFSDMNMEQLKVISERLRVTVEKYTMFCNNENIHITITIGGALSQEDESFDSLLNRADIALYEGKEKGRNQVSIKLNA